MHTYRLTPLHPWKTPRKENSLTFSSHGTHSFGPLWVRNLIISKFTICLGFFLVVSCLLVCLFVLIMEEASQTS